MVIISISEVYKYDRISENNEQPWIALLNKIKSYPLENEEFEINLETVTISHSFCSVDFLKILASAKRMKKMVIKLRNSDKSKINLEQVILLNGLENKIEVINLPLEQLVSINSRLEEQKKKDLEKQFESIYNKYSGMIVESEKKLTIKINNVLSQISSQDTYSNIKLVLNKCLEDKKDIESVVVDFQGVILLRHITSVIYEHLKELSIKYENIEIQGIDGYTQSNINKYKIMNKKSDSSYKYKYFKDHVTIGSIGILISYKHSKTLNEFGIYGDGNVNFTRVCMINGYNDIKKEIEFRVYKIMDFKTKEMMEIDERESTELKYYIEKIAIKEIGYVNEFLGSNYHFLNAVQHYDNNGEFELYKVLYTDDKKELKEEEVSMPELIKIVMENHNEKYNKELLEECLLATKEIRESR